MNVAFFQSPAHAAESYQRFARFTTSFQDEAFLLWRASGVTSTSARSDSFGLKSLPSSSASLR